MRNRLLPALLALFLVLSPAAFAAEPQPGDACTTNEAFMRIGGQENPGSGHFMVCAGGVWVNFIDYLSASGYVGVKKTAPAAPLHVGGEAIIGTTTGLACNSTRAGGLRWSSANSTFEMCDGTSWQKIAASTCDNAPAFPVFTDQSMLNTSTLVTSNIVAITGMDAGCSAVVGVSGTGGSPEYRICSTSNCSSVDINWTAGNNTVAMQGKYMQLRATTSASAGTTFTITASIGATTSNWNITTQYADCSGNPIGTVCGDGTVYAGTSPDSSVPMFVTRCDAGQSWTGSCTGTRTGKAYDDGNGNWVDTVLNNCAAAGGCAASGESNTAVLVNTDSNSVTAGNQVHDAAQYCADLSSNGYTDWYLPSAPELNVIYGNKTAIGQFDIGGNPYWSSSENNSSNAWHQEFSGGAQNITSKATIWFFVRCARRNADVTPAAFSFTDQTNQTAAALINSNILQITGLGAATQMAIANKSGDGTGNPEYRICSDSSCSVVVTGWNSGQNAISNNQYLQLRMNANGAASATNSVLAVVGDSTDQWDLTTSAGDPCAGSPNPGAVCTDGTVYAGLTPDGSVAMYVTRCDGGMTWGGSSCTGSPTLNPWNAGTSGNWVDTSLADCASALGCNPSGESNTSTLIATDSDDVTAGTQLHLAAQSCADLNIHGQTDWYLPSAPELNVLYTNRAAINMVINADYWSSSENDSSNAWLLAIDQSGFVAEGKNSTARWPQYYGNRTRCARK